MKFMRSLYDWTLKKSSHPKAIWFLSFISFIESSIFPVPPDIILIPMSIVNKARAFFYALVCTISSVLGGLVGYIIGSLLFNTIGIMIIDFYDLNENVDDFKEYYRLYGAWIVIVAGFTPFPFKVITLSSGLFNLNIIVFITCAIISRGARFYLLSFLIYYYGEKVKNFIDKYFNILSYLLIIVLLIFIFLFKFI